MSAVAASDVAPSRRGTRVLAALSAAFVACVVLVAGPAVLAQDDAPSPLSIRRVDATDADAVSVSLIWNGPRAALDDLTIREGGSEREHDPVVPLSKVGIETALVVAVDTSQSMARNGGVAETQKTLLEMIDNLSGGEAMGLVTFGSDVEELSPVTTDKDELRDAVDEIVAPSDAGTALWDGVRAPASLLEPDSELQPNIVLITDGYDDSSEDTNASQARSAVARAGAAVFALAYNAQQHVDVASLNTLVDRAGGAVIPAPERADLAGALNEVETSLANQYSVTFASQAEQGASDLEIGVGTASARTTFVSGAVSEGKSNLDPPSASSSIIPSFIRGDLGMIVAVAAGGIAVALAAAAVIMMVSNDETSLDRVLQQYTEPGVAEDDIEDGYAQTAFVQRAVDFTEEMAIKQGVLIKIERKLEQADLPLRAAEVLFFSIAGAIVVTILGLVVMGPIGLLIFGALAFVLPMGVLNYLGRRRQKKFDSQLPDMLTLLAGSLRAGYSLVQGVDAVATEVDGPMGRELRRIMTEIRLGRELEEAFETAAARVQSKDFEWAIMAIRIQREVGGNLSELLMTVAETMVDRERLRRDVSTLTAEGKVSAMILGVMPGLLGAVMYVVNPDYMSPLFTTGVGKGLLGVAALIMAIGFAWMKKCITIEV